MPQGTNHARVADSVAIPASVAVCWEDWRVGCVGEGWGLEKGVSELVPSLGQVATHFVGYYSPFSPRIVALREADGTFFLHRNWDWA